MNAVRKGGCLCGSVRYRTVGEPVRTTVCHCNDCQTRTGSAFAVLLAFSDQHVEFSGSVLTVYEHRSDESGRWIRNHFCGQCGVTVMLTIERSQTLRIISAGTFDDTSWFGIDRHIWTRSAQHWMSLPADAVKFEQAFPT